MAANYVIVDRTKQPGNRLVRLASMLTEVRSISQEIINVGGHTIDESDYTLLEEVFGLQAGDGEEVAVMVAAVNNILNNTTAVAGADRLEALDELTGRLGLQ